jgi:hypothetical protein
MGGETAVDDDVELSAEEQAAKAKADEEAAAKAKADEEAAAAAAGEDGESEGLEVVEAGATQASGRVIPLSAHVKAKGKWKQRVAAATDTAEAERQEKELLRLQLQQRDEEIARLKVPKGPPKRADFETDDAFDAARAKYDRSQTEALVVETLRKHAPTTPAAGQPVDEADDAVLDAHYERAAKLKAPDFDAAEDEVIAAIGKDATRQLIKQFDNSEALIYALGKLNPKRLAELQGDLKKDPVRAIVNLTKYASTLQLKPRGKAPDPDSPDERRGTHGSGDPQKQLDALRAKRAKGEATTDDVLKFKRECKAKGIKVV